MVKCILQTASNTIQCTTGLAFKQFEELVNRHFSWNTSLYLINQPSWTSSCRVFISPMITFGYIVLLHERGQRGGSSLHSTNYLEWLRTKHKSIIQRIIFLLHPHLIPLLPMQSLWSLRMLLGAKNLQGPEIMSLQIFENPLTDNLGAKIPKGVSYMVLLAT